MLKLPAKRVYGRLLTQPDSPNTIAVLNPENIEPEIEIFLRFAFILQGVEWPVMPAFVLDDWGRERRGLALFEWVFKNGDYFPRAEIFGYWLRPGKGWEETQVFVRDLELMSRWPVYAYVDKDALPEAGLRVRQIALEKSDLGEVRRIDRPADFEMPFTRAAVGWLAVPTGSTAINLGKPDGY